MSMVNAGRILILPRGEWDSATTYAMLDVVTASDGIAYIAKQASLNQDPTTDTQNLYWQEFGVTITADDETIVEDSNHVLSLNMDGESLVYDSTSQKVVVNIDNVTIKYDSENGYLYVDDVDKALSTLNDVTVTTPSNGQALIYDSATSKWKNANISPTLEGLTDTNISSPSDGEALIYDSTAQKWKNIFPTLAGLSDANISSPSNGQALIYDSATSKWKNGGISSSGHTIEDASGTTLAQRTYLQFKGVKVTDDSGNNRTIVDATIASYEITCPTTGYTSKSVTIQGVTRTLNEIVITTDKSGNPLSAFHTGMHEDYAINISGTESDFSKLFAHEIGEGEVTFYFTSAPSSAFNVLIREAV